MIAYMGHTDVLTQTVATIAFALLGKGVTVESTEVVVLI